MIVAAFAAEANVAEVEAEEEEGVAAAPTATAPKPKKGKAALPLKRDRVCSKIFFMATLRFVFRFGYGDWVVGRVLFHGLCLEELVFQA